MATFTATIVITTIPDMAASTSFQVSGTYQLNQSTWTDVLIYEDDAGTQVSIPSAPVQLGISNWSFTHAALPPGTHTVSVQDPFTGATVVSNKFTVGTAQTIVANPITGAVAGTPIVFTGTLTNFTSTPVLTYSLDSGPSQALSGVTTTGWSTQLTFSTAGSHTIVVSSASVTSNTVTFTVAPATVTHTIAPNVPAPAAGGTTITVGAIVNFTGTLTGYTSPPSLSYSINGATSVAMTGVTSSGWSMQFTAPSVVGSYTIVVSDGTSSGQATFSVAAAPPTITPLTPSNVIAGTSFTFQGTLNGYTSAPSLSYSLNGGAATTVTGVTITGWAMTLTIATVAASNTIVVSDGAGTTGSTGTFAVTAAGPPPPTAVTWNPNDLAGGIGLSNSNYTATSTGSTTAYAAPQGVRATSAINAFAVVEEAYVNHVVWYKDSEGNWFSVGVSSGQPVILSGPTKTSPLAASGPGTGPAVMTPVSGQTLDFGIQASSGVTATHPTNTSSGYEVQLKSHFYQYVGRPGEHGYYFHGATAGFIAQGIYLGPPDVTSVFTANGLPNSGIDPVIWYTAGAVTGPIAWYGYQDQTDPLTNGFWDIIVDFSTLRGDTFGLTANLGGSGYKVHTETWGSWLDFSPSSGGWIAFLGFDVSTITIGARAY